MVFCFIIIEALSHVYSDRIQLTVHICPNEGKEPKISGQRVSRCTKKCSSLEHFGRMGGHSFVVDCAHVAVNKSVITLGRMQFPILLH